MGTTRSLFSLVAIFVAGGCAAVPVAVHGARTPASAPAADSSASQRIEISVGERGFEPSRIDVPRNQEVTLVFTRRTDRTCAKEVIVYVDRNDPRQKIERALPLDQPVAIQVRFAVAGEHGFACAMGHRAGVINVN